MNEKDKAMKDFIKIIADIAKCSNMPSLFYYDWKWTKGMQITNWRKVFDAGDKAESQCKDWAYELKNIFDVLNNKTS